METLKRRKCCDDRNHPSREEFVFNLTLIIRFLHHPNGWLLSTMEYELQREYFKYFAKKIEPSMFAKGVETWEPVLRTFSAELRITRAKDARVRCDRPVDELKMKKICTVAEYNTMQVVYEDPLYNIIRKLPPLKNDVPDEDKFTVRLKQIRQYLQKTGGFEHLKVDSEERDVVLNNKDYAKSSRNFKRAREKTDENQIESLFDGKEAIKKSISHIEKQSKEKSAQGAKILGLISDYDLCDSDSDDAGNQKTRKFQEESEKNKRNGKEVVKKRSSHIEKQSKKKISKITGLISDDEIPVSDSDVSGNQKTRKFREESENTKGNGKEDSKKHSSHIEKQPKKKFLKAAQIPALLSDYEWSDLDSDASGNQKKRKIQEKSKNPNVNGKESVKKRSSHIEKQSKKKFSKIPGLISDDEIPVSDSDSSGNQKTRKFQEGAEKTKGKGKETFKKRISHVEKQPKKKLRKHEKKIRSLFSDYESPDEGSDNSGKQKNRKIQHPFVITIKEEPECIILDETVPVEKSLSNDKSNSGCDEMLVDPPEGSIDTNLDQERDNCPKVADPPQNIHQMYTRRATRAPISSNSPNKNSECVPGDGKKNAPLSSGPKANQHSILPPLSMNIPCNVRPIMSDADKLGPNFAQLGASLGLLYNGAKDIIDKVNLNSGTVSLNFWGNCRPICSDDFFDIFSQHGRVTKVTVFTTTRRAIVELERFQYAQAASRVFNGIQCVYNKRNNDYFFKFEISNVVAVNGVSDGIRSYKHTRCYELNPRGANVTEFKVTPATNLWI